MNSITPNPALSQAVSSTGGAANMFEVSRQWYSRPADERFTSLPDLLAFTSGLREASEANVIESRKVEILAPENPGSVAETQTLWAGTPDGHESDFTNWSFGQACRLAGAPASYMRTLPAQIAEQNLTFGLLTREELVKTYRYDRPEGGSELRAFTGPDYGRIFDCEIVEAVMEIAGDGLDFSTWHIPHAAGEGQHYGTHTGRVEVTKESTTLYASDRDLFIFLVDTANPIVIGKTADGRDDVLYRAFFIQNSEVGGRSCVLAAGYLRDVCGNRILWGVEGFQELRIRHSKFAPDRFVSQAVPALRDYSNASVQLLLDGVERAKEAKVAQDDEQAVAFLRNRGFSGKRALAVLERVEQEEKVKARSAWDMAQGITALARDEQHNDARLELEGQAQKILEKV